MPQNVTQTIPSSILVQIKRYSAFQQKVWLACSEIPAGETRTYKWIAERIGKPGASRAVGMALAANPFAPIIPCHRVVRTDGTLGGYSGPGGLARKQALLKFERENQGVPRT